MALVGKGIPSVAKGDASLEKDEETKASRSDSSGSMSSSSSSLISRETSPSPSSPSLSSSSSSSSPPPRLSGSLATLPTEMVQLILEQVDAKDLGRIDCVARAFHGGLVEHVLRSLAQRAAPGRAMPPLGGPPPPPPPLRRSVVAPRTLTQRLLREMFRRWWNLPGGAEEVERVNGGRRGDFGRLVVGSPSYAHAEDLRYVEEEVMGGARVVAVSAGSEGWQENWWFVMDDGSVCVWGDLASASRVTGIDLDAHAADEGADDAVDGAPPVDDATLTMPRRVDTLSGVRVCAVSIGGPDRQNGPERQFSIFLTEGGSVLSCGSGRWGQLGHGIKQDQHVPKLIEALGGVRVCAVSAGGTHSLFLAEDGSVLSCGLGSCGELGHRNRQNQLVPKLIEALSGHRVCAVSAGNRHSLFLTAGGAVLSCGWGFRGQLGHGNKKPLCVPLSIEALRGTRVCAISAAAFHSVFLAEDGSVLSSCTLVRRSGFVDGLLTPLVLHFKPKRIEAFHPSGPRVCAIKSSASRIWFVDDSGDFWEFSLVSDPPHSELPRPRPSSSPVLRPT